MSESHTLLAKVIHWGFILLYGYGILKQIEDLEQLEDRNIDLIENDNEGEKMYLAGLEVKGDRIVFLLDNSASMMDETLINIIRKSLLNDTKKKSQR